MPAGPAAAGGWGDTTVLLPSGPYVDALTGRRVDGGECRLAEVLED